MKIERIFRATLFFVTTDESDGYEYTRYSATNWTRDVDGYDERIDECEELEELFQNSLAYYRDNAEEL